MFLGYQFFLVTQTDKLEEWISKSSPNQQPRQLLELARYVKSQIHSRSIESEILGAVRNNLCFNNLSR